MKNQFVPCHSTCNTWIQRFSTILIGSWCYYRWLSLCLREGRTVLRNSREQLRYSRNEIWLHIASCLGIFWFQSCFIFWFFRRFFRCQKKFYVLKFWSYQQWNQSVFLVLKSWSLVSKLWENTYSVGTLECYNSWIISYQCIDFDLA